MNKMRLRGTPAQSVTPVSVVVTVGHSLPSHGLSYGAAIPGDCFSRSLGGRSSIAEALVKQTYEGWHISTSRGSMRCRSRQEAYTRLSQWMRREDLKRRTHEESTSTTRRRTRGRKLRSRKRRTTKG